ncbi:PTS sugar transporter subunit IIB [[Clostridium] innocuum]|nr:PTS sugar transporter subunit IIB [[Clostridium] innocuum]
MLKVLTVCINGMGSSLILKLTVERAFKELNVEAQIEHIDAANFKGHHADVIITTPALAKTIGEVENTVMITTKNFIDVKEIKEKIKEALNLE